MFDVHTTMQEYIQEKSMENWDEEGFVSFTGEICLLPYLLTCRA